MFNPGLCRFKDRLNNLYDNLTEVYKDGSYNFDKLNSLKFSVSPVFICNLFFYYFKNRCEKEYTNLLLFNVGDYLISVDFYGTWIADVLGIKEGIMEVTQNTEIQNRIKVGDYYVADIYIKCDLLLANLLDFYSISEMYKNTYMKYTIVSMKQELLEHISKTYPALLYHTSIDYDFVFEDRVKLRQELNLKYDGLHFVSITKVHPGLSKCNVDVMGKVKYSLDMNSEYHSVEGYSNVLDGIFEILKNTGIRDCSLVINYDINGITQVKKLNEVLNSLVNKFKDFKSDILDYSKYFFSLEFTGNISQGELRLEDRLRCPTYMLLGAYLNDLWELYDVQLETRAFEYFWSIW